MKTHPFFYAVFFMICGGLGAQLITVMFGSPFCVSDADLHRLTTEMNRYMPVDEGQQTVLWLERNKEGVLELSWAKSAITRGTERVLISKD